MSYLPRSEGALLAWTANMKLLISADAESFGLSVAQASAYSVAQAEYAAKLSLAQNPPTRTKVSVEEKNFSKTALIELTQEYVRIIQAFPALTDAQREALSITVKKNPTPVPIPSEIPEMDILSVSGRVVKARVHTAVDHRRRPALTAGASVWSFVGDVPPDELVNWVYWGLATKTTFEVTFPASVEPGAKVWLAAAWVNAKGETGPACDPQSAYVQFGGLSLPAAQAKSKAA